MYDSVIYHIVHYFPSTYLSTESLYLLTAFIQFSFPPLLAFGNDKSDFFKWVFVYFDSIIDLQHYVNSWYTPGINIVLYNIVIWYFYMFQNDHHDKTNDHLSWFFLNKDKQTKQKTLIWSEVHRHTKNYFTKT